MPGGPGLVGAVVQPPVGRESGVTEQESIPEQSSDLALGTQWQRRTRPCLLPGSDIRASTNK